MGAQKDTTRLRYDVTHWSRLGDREEALRQYLELGDRVYNKTKSLIIRKMLGDVRGKLILDYGGGAGIMAVPLVVDGAEVCLVDAEENALKTAALYARRKGVSDRIRFIHSDSLPDELKNGCFDIILIKDVIEHIDDDIGFIKDISLCQNIGGRMLLSTQNSFSLNYLIQGAYERFVRGNRDWRGWDQTHLRFYNYRVFRRLLTTCGYMPVKWGGVYIIPYNILSWFFLGRVSVELSSLSIFDKAFGTVYPFNRLGWNIMVSAEKVSDPEHSVDEERS